MIERSFRVRTIEEKDGYARMELEIDFFGSNSMDNFEIKYEKEGRIDMETPWKDREENVESYPKIKFRFDLYYYSSGFVKLILVDKETREELDDFKITFG